MTSNKSHLHIRRNIPLHPDQSTHNISFSDLHNQSHFALGDLLHNFRNLVTLIHFTFQQSTDERDLGRSRIFGGLEVDVKSCRWIDDGVLCQRVFCRGGECE